VGVPGHGTDATIGGDVLAACSRRIQPYGFELSGLDASHCSSVVSLAFRRGKKVGATHDASAWPSSGDKILNSVHQVTVWLDEIEGADEPFVNQRESMLRVTITS
jgi:hypothetical protein